MQMQLPCFGRVYGSENKQRFALFLKPNSSQMGELRQQATCYVYVLQLWSVLLKLPITHVEISTP